MIKLLVCGIAGFSADALTLERFTAAFKDDIWGVVKAPSAECAKPETRK
jgi:hypothetical protein